MITISLCMIVRDEEAVLPRILTPMKKIADEIIIVDTGSADSTREIAHAFTPLVFDFPWQDDFSAARNFALEKATMDYFLWLDADDQITCENQLLLLELKKTLSPSVDVVMMKYHTGFDAQGQATFSYYRERLLKNKRDFASFPFRFQGRVHEAITPEGNILYSPIIIEHRKTGPGDPDRNLRIYEHMRKNGELSEPRQQYYYGRELYYHEYYAEAAAVFETFLSAREAWIENRIEACLLLSCCRQQLPPIH